MKLSKRGFLLIIGGGFGFSIIFLIVGSLLFWGETSYSALPFFVLSFIFQLLSVLALIVFIYRL